MQNAHCLNTAQGSKQADWKYADRFTLAQQEA